MTKFLKNEKLFTGIQDVPQNCHTYRDDSKIAPEDKHAEFMFFPAFTGQIKPSVPKITVEGNCFEQVSFDMQWDETDPSVFTIVAEMGMPRSLTCSDAFFFANTEIHHFEVFAKRGTHTLKF